MFWDLYLNLIDKINSVVKTTKFYVALIIVSVLLLALGVYFFISYADKRIDSSTKLVTFYDDGKEKTILTKGKTVADAMTEAGLVVGGNDKVSPGVATTLKGSMTIVSVHRARPVTITDNNGKRSRVVTAETENSKIVKQAGMELRPHDKVDTGVSKNILTSGGIGQNISIIRAKTVNLLLYGQKMELHTQQSTVRDLLKEAGIKLASNDTITVKLNDAIVDGMSFRIWRNGLQVIEQDEEIPFQTETVNDATKKIGYTEIRTTGKKGKKKVIYQVNMRDGVEIGRDKISEVIVEPTINQVEIKGTKVELPPGSHSDWMAMAGIPESDYGATNYIISRESGWRYNASNPSGAYGLPQALPGSKMASAGSDWQTNPITQLRWFYSYCVGRYGSVQNAYEFWVKRGWY